ncbi:MAG TPA: hypothetical protein VF062_11495 [Candidatus Limnocylindrales bacterium]
MRRSLVVLALCTVLIVTSGTASVAAGLTIAARRAVLTGAGASVTLTGTYSCGPFTGGVPDRGVVDFTIRQSLAGQTVTGFGYLEPAACDGVSHPFSVDLPSVSELRFRRGEALWSASGYVEGDGGLQTVSVPPTTIRIR